MKILFVFIDYTDLIDMSIYVCGTFTDNNLNFD